MKPDTAKPLADLLAENGRPVDPAGLKRAKADLAAAADRRDPDARAALLEQIRTAA